MAKTPSLEQRQQTLRNSAMAHKAPLGLMPFGAEPSGELKALDPEDVAAALPILVQLPIEAIQPDPDQPRKHFTDADLAALAASLATKGLRNPVHVRRHQGTFVLIEGERRYRAAQRAGIKRLAAFVENVDADEAYELALIENMQRQNLDPLEEAAGISQLMHRRSYSQQQVGRLVGRSKAHISKLARIDRLPQEVKSLVWRPVSTSKLGLDQLYQIATQKGLKRQLSLARKVLAAKLNTRQTRQAARPQKAKEDHPLLVPLMQLEKVVAAGEQASLSPDQRRDTVQRLQALAACIGRS